MLYNIIIVIYYNDYNYEICIKYIIVIKMPRRHGIGAVGALQQKKKDEVYYNFKRNIHE